MREKRKIQPRSVVENENEKGKMLYHGEVLDNAPEVGDQLLKIPETRNFTLADLDLHTPTAETNMRRWERNAATRVLDTIHAISGRDFHSTTVLCSFDPKTGLVCATFIEHGEEADEDD